MASDDERYGRALELLQLGRPDAAAVVLQKILEPHPRAAQSLYLLGICLLSAGRMDEARTVLDRAYRVKPWIRDLSPADFDLDDLAEKAMAHDPAWSWPRYELERRAFFSVGLTMHEVVRRHLAHSEVFFLEVGANDGKDHDPIYDFVMRHGWGGIAVEPVPATYDLLRQTYEACPKIRCVQSAVTDFDGSVKIHLAKNSKLASLNPDRNAQSRDGVGETVDVPATTFKTLLSGHDVTSVDVLQIDTEGHDYRVLKGFDLARFQPLMINMEFYCLPLAERLATMRLLRSHGYAYRFTGMDLLAIDRKEAAPAFCLSDRTDGQFLPTRVRPMAKRIVRKAARVAQTAIRPQPKAGPVGEQPAPQTVAG